MYYLKCKKKQLILKNNKEKIKSNTIVISNATCFIILKLNGLIKSTHIIKIVGTIIKLPKTN